MDTKIDKTDALRGPRTHDLTPTQAKPQANLGENQQPGEETGEPIDFAAALADNPHHPPHPDPAQPKRGPGRPRKPAPPPDPNKRGRGRPKGWKKPKPTTDTPLYNIDNNINKGSNRCLLYPDILVGEMEEEISEDNKPGLKEGLKGREIKFLELYLSGHYTTVKAMKAAGYTGYNDHYLGILGTKLVRRYESQAGDHRKIMRALGWGEVRVLQSLIEAATKFGSETVKLNARVALAKCLGIQSEVLEAVQGIQIVINSPKAALVEGERAQVGSAQQPAITQAPGPRPLQITK